MRALMRAIGGYFELELANTGGFIHDDGLCVNSGRNAFELILRNLPDCSKVYVPLYTCEVVLEPLLKLNIPYTFYSINSKLELADELRLDESDYLLYTNYFGVKDSYVCELSKKYAEKLIVDNAQALYAKPTEKCFYSPRKFMGIPDSGVAYFDGLVSLNAYDQDVSYERCAHLLKRIDVGAEIGYSDFRNNSEMFKGLPIRQMSNLSRALLCSIDFESVRRIRIENFKILHSALRDTNLLTLEQIENLTCPMVYPYMTDDRGLRKKLIDNRIFVAQYWPNVTEWCSSESLEFDMVDRIVPLPIDQRYTTDDMEMIIKLIKYGN